MEPSKKLIRILSSISLIFGILALIWLIYDYVLYTKLKLTMLETTELGKLEIYGVFVWISYLYMFAYHIMANGTLILHARYIRKIEVLHVIALMLGVVSFLGLFGDLAVLSDISKEYIMGWDISGEWRILFIILGIHAVYLISVTAISAGMVRAGKKPEKERPVEQKDEMVFTLAQYVGIVCGLLGIAYTFMGMILSRIMDIQMNPQATVYHMASSTVLILIPYGMIIIYWLTLKLKERMADWYDEKQWRDLTKAGFTTLLVTIPTIGLFFFAVSVRHVSYSETLLWFPFTLFLILFLFSLFTLINYRKA